MSTIEQVAIELEQLAKKIKLEQIFNCKIELQVIYFRSGKVCYSPQYMINNNGFVRLYYLTENNGWMHAYYDDYNNLEYWNSQILKYFDTKQEAMEELFSFMQ